MLDDTNPLNKTNPTDNTNSPENSHSTENANSTPNKSEQLSPDSKQPTALVAGGKQMPETGKPKTKAFYRMGNKNAMVHGVHSKRGLLPWESAEEFQKLYEDIRKEYQINGRSEEEIAWDLTYYRWLKLRLHAANQIRFAQSTVPAQLKTGQLTLEDMIQHQADVPQQAIGALNRVPSAMEEFDEVFKIIRNRRYSVDTSDGKQLQDNLWTLEGDVSSLKEKTRETLDYLNTLVEIVTRSAGRFAEAYQLEDIDKQIDRIAKIDVREEKAFRRLITIKEYKRLMGLNSVESPSLTSTELSQTDFEINGERNLGDDSKSGPDRALDPPKKDAEEPG